MLEKSDEVFLIYVGLKGQEGTEGCVLQKVGGSEERWRLKAGGKRFESSISLVESVECMRQVGKILEKVVSKRLRKDFLKCSALRVISERILAWGLKQDCFRGRSPKSLIQGRMAFKRFFKFIAFRWTK